MLEDSGDTKFIEEFLLQVIRGESFIEDIWIERDVKRPGTGTQESTEVTEAQSLSRNPISNVTELLEDDLRHSFEKRFFTFRFVAAIAGSGKTTLLQYLEKIITFNNNYFNRSIVFRFDLPRILSISNSQSVRNKFYFYLLANTFQKILSIQEIKVIAEHILRELLGNEIAAELLKRTATEIGFRSNFIRCFSESGIEVEEIFFYIIEQVWKSQPNYTFVYLIDELDDVLRENTNYDQPIRSVFRSLINKTYQDYQQKIPLMIYLAGTSDIARKFLVEDLAFESRVRDSVIRLVPGRLKEFNQIKDKIIKRVKDAYQGQINFEIANREIENIQPHYADSNKILRNFCKEYAGRVLEIYKHYLVKASENAFDGTVRILTELVKSECEHQWKDYLEMYELKIDPNILKTKHFSFCRCATLEENGNIVARAYFGARNYELLKCYIDNFISQLDAENYHYVSYNQKPHDIAFIIAPQCSIFLNKILENRKIIFINSSNKAFIQTTHKDENLNKTHHSKNAVISNNSKCIVSIDINIIDTDEIENLKKAFEGIKIGDKIIENIIHNRPYKNLDDLASHKIKFLGTKRIQEIKKKIDNGQLCFKIGLFLCHNSKDKLEVKKIAEQLKERKISVWFDEWDLIVGDHWPRVLDKQIDNAQMRSAAVFIGKEGIGPWQTEEMYALLQKCVKRGHRVIPVILKSCKGEPDFPSFLELRHAVDLRQRNINAIEKLIEGIKHWHI
ncbi:TIR domain-containing protein [Mastigocladus laminosus UU774]|nr:TIR domain-containing protein [Mastigocladus laminosus UU774]